MDRALSGAEELRGSRITTASSGALAGAQPLLGYLVGLAGLWTHLGLAPCVHDGFDLLGCVRPIEDGELAASELVELFDGGLAALPHVAKLFFVRLLYHAQRFGFTGILLAASVGSADLELGNPYLLASVGAVVLGGNRIAGGMATIVGTVAGALVLTLLVAVVTVAGMPLEFQNIARGIVITLVLVLASAHEERRGRVTPLSILRWPRRKEKPQGAT